MPGTIDSLAQCLLFMKGSTIRFFGTATACTGREALILIIGQVSGRTPITNSSIDPHANNVKHRARTRARSGARVHMHPPPTCSLPLHTRHAHAICVPLRKALFDSSSNPHSKDGPNPSSFLTQLWCSSSIGRVDYKLRHSDCAAKCSGPSICPRRRHSHLRRLHSAPSHWSHFADNAWQIHFERPCCAGVQHNWLIRARAGLKQTRDMPRGSMPLVCSPVFRN